MKLFPISSLSVISLSKFYSPLFWDIEFHKILTFKIGCLVFLGVGTVLAFKFFVGLYRAFGMLEILFFTNRNGLNIIGWQRRP